MRSRDDLLKLVEEKRKYFKKVLSRSAMNIMFDRVFDTEDIFQTRVYLSLLPFLNAMLSFIEGLGFSPEELEPMNLDFVIELPTVDEWLRGVKIKFRRVDVGEDYKRFIYDFFKEEIPPKLDFDRFVEDNIRDVFQPPVRRWKYTKARYGKSRFGRAYYDPNILRCLVQGAILEFYKRHYSFESLRKYLKTFGEKFGIDEVILREIFNRISLTISLLREGFLFGLGMLGYTKLGKRVGEMIEVEVETYDRERVKVRVPFLTHSHAGFILGLTPLGYGKLLHNTELYKSSKSPRGEFYAPKIIQYYINRAMTITARYRATPLALANYQTIEEQTDVHKSERCGQWHLLRTLTFMIDNIIANTLRGVEDNIVKINMYKRAVNQLIGHRKKRHKWGYDLYKRMSDEEFKEWWIDHWTKMGLNPNILLQLYNRLKKVLPHLVNLSKEVGERLRKMRMYYIG